MSLYGSFRRYVSEEAPVALATVIAGPAGVGEKLLIAPETAEGTLHDPEVQRRVVADARRLLQAERSDTVTYDLPAGQYQVFIDAYPSPPHLIIVGASQTAVPLSAMAKILGYRVTLTDARAAFAIPERFPAADAVVKGWPQDVLPTLRFTRGTYVVLLSHDPKFDQPTLEHVLPTPVRYIGAIGSRKTQRERFARLRAQGYTEEQLARIHGPVGLDLGGRSAEETALAILAEMTAVRFGGTGGFMRERLDTP